MFKVGDRVRFTQDNPNGGAKYGRKGQEAVIARIYDGVSSHYGRQVELEPLEQCEGFEPDAPVSAIELVQPVGPVVTETVTKTRIVPGVYDGVKVVEVDDDGFVSIEIVDGNDCPRWMDADQLDAAAAVLSALAKGLRDA